MKRKIPLLLMFAVLIAPFAVSLVLLENKDSLGNRAKGSWLNDTQYVEPVSNRNWQLVWNKKCDVNCTKFINLLRRVKMALGKRQDKLTISPLKLKEESQQSFLEQDRIFIADQNGLLLLSYQADEGGAYKLLKDLKTLMKHGGA